MKKICLKPNNDYCPQTLFLYGTYDENGKPIRLEAVVLSTQHDDDVTQEQIHKDIRECVFDPILPKELIDKGYSRTAVNIIVTIYHDTFLTSHGIIEPIHRDIHILHQERIDKVIELRTEKALCRRFRRYSTLNKKTTKHRSDIEFLTQFARLSHQCRRWCIINPFEMHDRVCLGEFTAELSVSYSSPKSCRRN